MSSFPGTDQLIELELNRGAVPVLAVLNQKHHKKSHDGCRRVDDQLPGVAVMKERSRHRPKYNCADRDNESHRVSQGTFGLLGKLIKEGRRTYSRSILCQDPHGCLLLVCFGNITSYLI